jgi:hypothetical protein
MAWRASIPQIFRGQHQGQAESFALNPAVTMLAWSSAKGPAGALLCSKSVHAAFLLIRNQYDTDRY